MNEIIRKTVEKGFEDSIDLSIQDEKRRYPNEWDKNPLLASCFIRSAIAITKEEFKKMIKDNHLKFGIAESDVDDFVEEIGNKLYHKYFY